MVRHAYIRFVTAAIDWNSSRRQGVFQAAYDLRDSKEISGDVRAELRALLKWFDVHLKRPKRFAWNNRSNAAPKAISWFKSSATEYVSRMYSICRILNEHDIATEVIMTAGQGMSRMKTIIRLRRYRLGRRRRSGGHSGLIVTLRGVVAKASWLYSLAFEARVWFAIRSGRQGGSRSSLCCWTRRFGDEAVVGVVNHALRSIERDGESTTLRPILSFFAAFAYLSAGECPRK